MYVKIKCKANVDSPIRLPPIKGNSIRGAIGYTLKEETCIYPKIENCKYCKMKHICGFSYVFNSFPPPNSNKLEKLDKITRPYSIICNDNRENYFPGDSFEFDVILIGKAIHYYEQIVNSIKKIDSMGSARTKGYGKINIETEVVNKIENNKIIPFEFSDNEFTGKINILTLTTLIKNNKLLVEPSFKELLSFAIHKYSSICYFHIGKYEEINYADLLNFCEDIKIKKSNIKGNYIIKWSQTQGKKLKLPAIYGTIEYDINKLLKHENQKYFNQIKEILSVASITGIGRMTTGGFGKIECK